jgi:hypothetical protein
MRPAGSRMAVPGRPCTVLPALAGAVQVLAGAVLALAGAMLALAGAMLALAGAMLALAGAVLALAGAMPAALAGAMPAALAGIAGRGENRDLLRCRADERDTAEPSVVRTDCARRSPDAAGRALPPRTATCGRRAVQGNGGAPWGAVTHAGCCCRTTLHSLELR